MKAGGGLWSSDLCIGQKIKNYNLQKNASNKSLKVGEAYTIERKNVKDLHWQMEHQDEL